MIKKKKFLLLIFLGVFLKSYSVEMTVEDIIRRAKLSNNQIKIQELDKNIKLKTKEKAFKNLMLPPIKVSAEEEWSVVKKDGFGANELSAYIPIFVGGKNINSYRKAQAEFDISEKDEILIRNTVEEIAVLKYFETLNYKRQIEISNLTIKALKNQRERLRLLFEGGKLIPKSELLKVDANLERNQSLKLEDIRKAKLVSGELNKLLNYPLDTEYKEVPFDLVNFIKNRVNIAKEIKKEIGKTTLAQKEKIKVDIANYDLKIAKSELYPKFYLKPTFQYQDKVNPQNGDPYLEKRSKSDRYALEVGFSWTFAWGGTLDNVNQKKWMYEKAKLEYEDNIKGIELEADSRTRRLDILQKRVLASEKEIQYLEENLKIDDMRYEAGLISTFDYLNSVNSYRSSQAEYYKMVKKLVIATMELENIYK